MKRLLLITGMALMAALPAFAGNTVLVHMFNFDFSVNPIGGPIEDVVINVGDTVRWVLDEGMHNTKSVDGIPEVWESQVTNVVGSTYDHTFTNVGVWWYYCVPHGFDMGNQTAGGMSGTVTVVPEPATFAVLGAGLAMLALTKRKRK